MHHTKEKGYKAVLLDLDGTIIESAPGILETLAYTFDKIGHEFDPEGKLDLLIGPPLTEIFEACGLTDEKQVENAMHIYHKYYRSKGMLNGLIYPGVRETLQRLKEQKIVTMVATSKPEPFAKSILEHFELDQYLAFISGSTLDEAKDNKPLVIANALQHYAGDKSEVLMVGDRHFDVDGAHRNVIDCAGVLYGYGSEKELIEAGADYLLKKPEELFELL